MAYLCIYNNSECDGCGDCEQDQEEVEVDIDYDYEIGVALERAERKNQEYIDRV